MLQLLARAVLLLPCALLLAGLLLVAAVMELLAPVTALWLCCLGEWMQALPWGLGAVAAWVVVCCLGRRMWETPPSVL